MYIFFVWSLMAVKEYCTKSLESDIEVPSSPNNMCECACLCHVSLYEWKFNLYDT